MPKQETRNIELHALSRFWLKSLIYKGEKHLNIL